MALGDVKSGIRTRGVLAKYVERNCVAYVCANRLVVGLALIFLILHTSHVGTRCRVESWQVSLVEKGCIGNVEAALFLNYRSHED